MATNYIHYICFFTYLSFFSLLYSSKCIQMNRMLFYSLFTHFGFLFRLTMNRSHNMHCYCYVEGPIAPGGQFYFNCLSINRWKMVIFLKKNTKLEETLFIPLFFSIRFFLFIVRSGQPGFIFCLYLYRLANRIKNTLYSSLFVVCCQIEEIYFLFIIFGRLLMLAPCVLCLLFTTAQHGHSRSPIGDDHSH